MARMTIRGSAVVIFAVSLLVAGCGAGEEPEDSAPPTSAPTVDGAPETSDAPADDDETTTAAPELSVEEQDQADVEATLQAFDAALASAITDEGSIEGIYPFSRDTAREQWVTQVMAYEAQGMTFSGESELKVLAVFVDGDIAQAVACRDVTRVEGVDGEGKSIIAEGRLDYSLQDFVLERDDSGDLGWYVISDVSRNEPCGG